MPVAYMPPNRNGTFAFTILLEKKIIINKTQWLIWVESKKLFEKKHALLTQNYYFLSVIY